MNVSAPIVVTPPPTPTPTPTPTPLSFTVNGIHFALTACASEYGTCSFSGKRHVAYGANDSYNILVAQ